MSDEILDEAKKHLSDFDFIVDLFDLQFIWANQNVSDIIGFSKDEIIKKHVLDLLVINENEYRRSLVERMTKGSGNVDLIMKRKDNTHVSLSIQFCTMSFNGGEYLIDKITSSKQV